MTRFWGLAFAALARILTAAGIPAVFIFGAPALILLAIIGAAILIEHKRKRTILKLPAPEP